MKYPSISIIIPVYNEEKNLPLIFEQLYAVLEKLHTTYEILFIDDGSTDNSWKQIELLIKKCSFVKGIKFQRNYGQTAAMQAGIDMAQCSVIIPIDADLQNDPTDIPALLKKLQEGYDVVSGWRKDRKDAKIKRNFLSRLANGLISFFSGLHLNDYGCTLKAYNASIIKNVHLYGEMHRFIPLYAQWEGARITEIPVKHHPRQHGFSKYGLNRTIKVLLDLAVVCFLQRYFTRPIYLFGSFGLFSILFSFFSIFLALFYKFYHGLSLIQTPLPLLAALLFLVGIISILLGFLAEILMRTYFESQNKKSYRIQTFSEKRKKISSS